MRDKIIVEGEFVEIKFEELIKVREDKLKTLHYAEDQTNLENHLLKRVDREDSQDLSTDPQLNDSPLTLRQHD